MNLTIVFLAIVVVVLIYSFVFHKKRSAQFQEISSKLGLTEVQQEVLADRLGDLNDFLYPNGVSCELKDGEERKRKIGFRSGWGASRSNGDLSVVDLSIGNRYFNNRATSQSGGSDSLDRESRKFGMSVTQTVVCYQLKNSPLPHFIISERLPFEGEYVSVNGSDQIGKHYRVCALDKDKMHVQSLIGEEIQQLLATERLWSIESHGDRLFVYQQNWLAPAAKLESLINTASQIVKELTDKSTGSFQQERAV